MRDPTIVKQGIPGKSVAVLDHPLFCPSFISINGHSKKTFLFLSPQILSGEIAISTLDPTYDLDGVIAQFILTCISTGGPATTVTWTRDSTNVTEETETVLDDPETAQYTHTLTLTTAGEYTCTVENDKPSSDSATITLGGTLFTA